MFYINATFLSYIWLSLFCGYHLTLWYHISSRACRPPTVATSSIINLHYDGILHLPQFSLISFSWRGDYMPMLVCKICLSRKPFILQCSNPLRRHVKRCMPTPNRNNPTWFQRNSIVGLNWPICYTNNGDNSIVCRYRSRYPYALHVCC